MKENVSIGCDTNPARFAARSLRLPLHEFETGRGRIRQSSCLKPGQKFFRPYRNDLKSSPTRQPSIDGAYRGGVPNIIITRHVVLIMRQFPKAEKISALVPW